MDNATYEQAYADMESGFISPKQLVWMKKHETCKHEFQNNFSYYRNWDDHERVPHFYCISCCTRWHDGKEYNPKEWDEYVNS